MHPLESLPAWLQVDEKGTCVQTSQICRFKPCGVEGKQDTHVTLLMADGEDIHVACSLIMQQIARETLPPILRHIMSQIGRKLEENESEEGRYGVPSSFEPHSLDALLSRLARDQEPVSSRRGARSDAETVGPRRVITLTASERLPKNSQPRKGADFSLAMTPTYFLDLRRYSTLKPASFN